MGHTEPPADAALRVKAIESLLIEKGIVDPGAIDEVIEIYEHRVGPRNGAKVVAKAWTDPAYKARFWLTPRPQSPRWVSRARKAKT